MDQNKSFNLLLLGETGVGKSTFINSFANYLKFPTADQARAGNPTHVIPTKFTMTDDDGETHTIKVGEDKNETLEEGQSQTQNCKAYLFKHLDRVIRLIDTPGIGDTRGLSQDRTNSESILAFVSHYSEVHGVLILLKPNHARLENNFRFCVMELLTRLHKKASDNIVFLFTNSRGTSFRPAGTINPLKILLQEIKDNDATIDIQITPSRTYCVDNEGYRYVLAAKQNIAFSADEIQDYNLSWTKSAEEINRLVNHVVLLAPHMVSDMISINDARRMVIAFSKPLGDISQLILVNISVVKEHQVKIQQAGEDKTLLENELYVPQVEIETERCDMPITVCTSPSCIEVTSISGIEYIDYVQKCHDPCYLQNVTPNVVSNEDLRHCAAMSGENCQICRPNCNWRTHMHIYFRNKQAKKVHDRKPVTPDDVQTIETVIQKSRKIVDDLKKQRVDLEFEKSEITKISAIFAQFLHQNCLTTYNDAIEDYLGHLIEGERKKCSSGTHQVLKELQDMLEAYKEERKILQEEMQKGTGTGHTDNDITPNQIKDYTKKLFDLPIHGPVLKKMVLEYEDATRKEHETFTEVFFQ